MDNKLIEKNLIPLDKSWMMRVGILDLINGYKDITPYLGENIENLGDDLKSLLRVSKQWNSNQPLEVGESGTLYRFLKFTSWKLKLDKKFILRGTLKNRDISNNPKIINWTIEELLTIDNGTTQWASASTLLGNNERIVNPPYKLQVTYDAVNHWINARKKGEKWKPRFDKTILSQAIAYSEWVKLGKINFVPKQAEDYCFARAFGLITAKEGGEKWPSLRGHESDRIAEMEKELKQNEITSKDHRVIQAIAMLKRNNVKIKYPKVVDKSWPQFWRFWRYSNKKLNLNKMSKDKY